MKIAKQNPERVANTAMSVPRHIKTSSENGTVGRVINTVAQSRSNQPHTCRRSDRQRLVSALCAGFGDFFAVQIDHETVGPQILYGARLFSAMLVMSDD